MSDESGSTTIRNLGLVLAGLIALPLAIWRGLVAQSQANAAQQSLRNERYQKGAEMLGHDALSVRLGGIYALQRLAEDFPEEYHVQILRLLSAFARHPQSDDGHEEEMKNKFGAPHIREDIQAVLNTIGKRDLEQFDLEYEDGLFLDLTNSNLQFGDLRKAYLAFAYLHKANLFHATLTGADLRHAHITSADLRNTRLDEADLSDALIVLTQLSDANLSGANLSRVIGLTQSQLDQARSDPRKPPTLGGTKDLKTGKPLVWQGKPLED